MPDVRTRHRSIDVAASHCERLRALSPSLFQTDRLSTYSLSVTGCCLRTNGRFAPIAAQDTLAASGVTSCLKSGSSGAWPQPSHDYVVRRSAAARQTVPLD